MYKRLILITIDCWRKDRLEIFGYNRQVLPNINKLCKNSIVFENLISNSSNTAPSFYALFTSKIPVIDGIYTPLPPEQKQFSEILMKNKIVTCGIHSNPHLGRICNYDKGFNYFFDMFENPQDASRIKIILKKIYWILVKIGVKKDLRRIKEKFVKFLRLRKIESNEIEAKLESIYTNAEITTKKAIEWIQAHQNSNFFLWIHYMDAHRPYFPPNKYIMKFSDDPIPDSTKLFLKKLEQYFTPVPSNKIEIREEYMQQTTILYDAELNYIDHYIGILFLYLKELNIYDNTALILTADHGEAVFEHNLLGHQISLYDELLNIPLIIKLIGSKGKQKIITKQIELIDIAPTILDFYNISKEKDFRGMNLICLIKNHDFSKKPRYVISALLRNNNRIYTKYREIKLMFYILISCRTTNWKLIYDEQTNNYEFFNIKEDPNELVNLFYVNSEKLIPIRNEFKAVINKYIDKYRSEEEKIKRSLLGNLSKLF